MENKNKLNKNKIILEDFNCTMDKMARDGENKTQRLYWCCSSYALSKLFLDNGLRIYREGRTQIPLSSPPTIRPLARIQDLFCQGSIDISPSKTKIEKGSRKRFIKVILFYVSPSTPQLQRRLFFITNTKNNHPSASHWQEYTKCCFKENAKILSKNSTTQENITIPRKILFLLLKTQKKQPLQQVSGGETPNECQNFF